MVKLIFVTLSILLSDKMIAQAKASASASVTIVSPVGAISSGDTFIGEFVGGSTQALIEIGSEGALKLSGGVKALTTEKETHVASFSIIGDSFVYDLSLPAGSIFLKRKKSEEMIKMSFFTIKPGISGSSNYHRFTIGATLTIEALQPAGFYTSENALEVVVNFN